jgi:hypothetical protein
MNVNNALAIVRDYHPTIKVAEVYDEDAEFASALSTLFPDFESLPSTNGAWPDHA